MRMNPAIKSTPLFFLAIAIEVVASLVLIGCVNAYVIDLSSLQESADSPDLESFNFFSRTIFESAITTVESSGSNSPTAVIDAAKSTIFILGGVSFFASIGAFLMLAMNSRTPGSEQGSDDEDS